MTWSESFYFWISKIVVEAVAIFVLFCLAAIVMLAWKAWRDR